MSSPGTPGAGASAGAPGCPLPAEPSPPGAAPTLDRAIADMAGPAALPRKNGELVFDAAWAGRAFGMTVAMHRARAFAWNDFRDRLIAEIAAAEAAGAGSAYYERWLRALERLVIDHGLVAPAELEARIADFAAGRRDDVF